MTGVLFAPVSLGPTGCRSARTLDLRRVYEAPFLDRPGKQPLWQGSKREEAGITSNRSPR